VEDHDHEHDHQEAPSDPALRVMALESLLVEKGLVDPAALDALIDTYEQKIGPRNGARVVARASEEGTPSGSKEERDALGRGGDARKHRIQAIAPLVERGHDA